MSTDLRLSAWMRFGQPLEAVIGNYSETSMVGRPVV